MVWTENDLYLFCIADRDELYEYGVDGTICICFVLLTETSCTNMVWTENDLYLLCIVDRE